MSEHETVLTCPFCGKDNHLYLNTRKRVYHCFKCNRSGRAGELEQLGVVAASSNILEPEPVRDMVDELENHPPVYPLTEENREYLQARQVSPLFYHDILRTAKGLLFLFPDEDYWQERRWEPFTPPRWKNPSEAPLGPGQGVTYHLRSDAACDTIVLVEGIFDALRIASNGMNAAAMLSSNYHERQMERLIARGYRSAVLLFDRDVATSKRFTMFHRAASLFDRAMIHDYHGCDPAEMDQGDLLHLKEVIYDL